MSGEGSPRPPYKFVEKDLVWQSYKFVEKDLVWQSSILGLSFFVIPEEHQQWYQKRHRPEHQ